MLVLFDYVCNYFSCPFKGYVIEELVAKEDVEKVKCQLCFQKMERFLGATAGYVPGTANRTKV